MKTITKLLLLLFCAFSYAQTSVNGNVTDDSGQPLPGANVIVLGTTIGAVTDFDGNYKLSVDQAPPFSIQVSSIGFETATKKVTTNPQTLDFALNEGNELDEIVISASRTPESVRESPVTIERFDARDIQFAASPNFYTSLENLKGVDVNQGSLTFSSVNTRGFATFANTRFVQLIDGMDNSSPALNFVLGNLVGMNELDVSSIELLPGASSALYGANAFNGILFMTSKNPFDHAGISVYFKAGITSQDAAGDNEFYDLGIRAAYVFSDKFAAKASFSHLNGTDWYATDNKQYILGLSGEPDAILSPEDNPLTHSGINVYGGEVSLSAAGSDLNQVAQFLESIGAIPDGASAFVPAVDVARTGYAEADLTDYEASSTKLDVSLNYKPFANDIEVIWNSRIGFGNSIYQGADRYNLKNFLMQQHKLEVRGDNFFVRGYTTAETAGDSYDMRFTGINMNKVNASQWFGTYAGAYLTGIFGGATDEQAHAGARVFADQTVTLQPGTPEFQELFNKIITDPDIATGSKFLDNTKMYVAEGNYNFKRLINDYMDLQVGGNYRQYSLDSGGTIFTDSDGPIEYDEVGAYVQAIKKFDDDRLKITASLRYDKNEFFDASYSPRLSVNYALGENRQHNVRASFQKGFRNPDTQSLFIGFNVGRAILVGSAPDNLDRALPGTNLTGRDAYFDSYTLSSVFAFSAAAGAGDPNAAALLRPVVTALVEQEEVSAIEVGYRGKIGPITVDFNAYYNSYDGFIANTLVVTPNTGSTDDITGVIDLVSGNTTVFQTYTNSLADVESYGAVIELSTKIVKDYKLSVNYTNSQFDLDQSKDIDFRAGFNTPEHKVKASFGNRKLFPNFGFNVNVRWSDEYLWEASIANAIIPSRTVIDAQINYSMPSIKSIFKIGATNLGGKEYQSAVGSAFIGSQYFISWTINN